MTFSPKKEFKKDKALDNNFSKHYRIRGLLAVVQSHKTNVISISVILQGRILQGSNVSIIQL